MEQLLHRVGATPSPTPSTRAEGGTHEEGFRAALTSHRQPVRARAEAAREKDDNLTGEDIREGLTAIISVKLADPQFEGQTKTKLGNTEAKSFVQKACNEHLRDWLEPQPRTRPRTSSRKAHPGRPRPDRGPPGPRPDPAQGSAGVGVACRASWPTASRTTRRSARSTSSRVTPPAARPRAAATRSTRRSSRSAARSSTSRRRGSTGSCKNNEVQALITALGTGVHEEFDIAKLRYHKIILMADADVDGQHITHPAADPAVPLHAAAGRGRARLPRRSPRSTRSSGTGEGRRSSTPTPTASATR